LATFSKSKIYRLRNPDHVGWGGKGRENKGRERAEGGDRVGKGEAGLDLDICQWALEFLVTPLPHLHLAPCWGDPGGISLRSLASEN